MKDFFISYTQNDKQWAEWIAWILEEAEYSVVLQAWDFRAGQNFVEEMKNALNDAEKTIAVLSSDYLKSDFTNAEYNGAWAKATKLGECRLIPVRVGECDQADLFNTIIYVDLVGVTEEDAAKQKLLRNLKNDRMKPATKPKFPRDERTGEAPTFPQRKPFPGREQQQLRVSDADVVLSEEPIAAPQNIIVEDLGNGVILDMIEIPGGEFTMGSNLQPEEQPQHRVTIPSFFMGKFPVTQAQWQAIAKMEKVEKPLQQNQKYEGSNLPMGGISWVDAEEFCGRLSRETGRQYRLPSEAEWEYACRARTTTPFHFGEKITDKLAHFGGHQKTKEVGSFSANKFGLYDMHGNVSEWCKDLWHDDYKGAPTDGSAWIKDGNQSNLVVRGGSRCDISDRCRSAYRFYSSRWSTETSRGFRVVYSCS